MKIFKTIESWASSLGYVVERKNDFYEWHKEDEFFYKVSSCVEELMKDILEEISNSYKGEK